MKLLDLENKNSQMPIVASIGFFDGVHMGHRYLIEQVREEAKRRSLPSAVITFPVHPRKVLCEDYQPALLCGYNEKIKRLESTGVDYCCPLDFTVEISKMSAKQFMQEVLKDRLNVDTLVVGYDHRFGHNREDGFEQYQAYGKEIGINVVLAKELELEGEGEVSSSEIRRLLAEGDVKGAGLKLSYEYSISGKIIEGFKVGRTIGFPTANMEVWERYKVIPALGVYAVRVEVEGECYDAMLYIGRRPTLHNGEHISIEVNLFDFDGDLYNKILTAYFLEFVRPDEKFEGLEKLKEQIATDRETVKQLLSSY